MNQTQLPLSMDDFIPENHLVRVVNKIVESLDLQPLPLTDRIYLWGAILNVAKGSKVGVA